MKNKTSHYVQLFKGDVELSISLDKNLKPNKGVLKNFGFIQVSSGSIRAKECFWDNLDWFLETPKKEIKKEVKSELGEAGFEVRETIRTIKQLLKEAKKLKLLK